MTHFCVDLQFSRSPSVVTACGMEADLKNPAKVVWEGVDCPTCLAMRLDIEQEKK